MSDDKLAHYTRVLDGDLQGNADSHAPPKEVSLFDLELPEECGGVVRQLLIGERPINVGRVPVSLLFNGGDLPGRGQGRQPTLVLSSSMCEVAILSRLVGKDHDPRRMRLGVYKFQLHLVLDALKERLSAP